MNLNYRQTFRAVLVIHPFSLAWARPALHSFILSFIHSFTHQYLWSTHPYRSLALYCLIMLLNYRNGVCLLEV